MNKILDFVQFVYFCFNINATVLTIQEVSQTYSVKHLLTLPYLSYSAVVIVCQMEDINLSKNILTYSWFYVLAALLKLVRDSASNRLSDQSKIFLLCAYQHNVAQSHQSKDFCYHGKTGTM